MFKPASKNKAQEFKINQANSFYNYTLGFDSANIDLLKTGERFLREKIATSVFFSDFKCRYIDKSDDINVEFISRTGRDFHSNWTLEFSQDIPKSVIEDLHNSCQIAFHENQIQNSNKEPPYLRICMPPIFLDNAENQLYLSTSVKIHSDGIAILSFQIDATWNELDEKDFLSNIVNIYKYYFKSIWVDSHLQKLDAKVILSNTLENNFSIAGQIFSNRKTKSLAKKVKNESQKLLNEALQHEGNYFDLNERKWELHKIVGSEDDESAELTIELCRSIYCNAISTLLVKSKNEKIKPQNNFMWQGRPSITLLRFENQPNNKEELFNNFSYSISNILLRADKTTKRSKLPRDLRYFDDFCLHGNRAILLSTWLKSKNSPKDAWEDPNTASMIFAGQARTELIEYYNLKIARACAWAQNPQSNEHLLYAYKILASSDNIIHQSSNAGEIVDSLSYLMGKFGTTGLINSGKESAKYYLDELKYNTDKIKTKNDRTLTLIFGLVGAASLAQFAVHPLVKQTWPLLNDVVAPFVSFGISGITLILLTKILSFINNK